MTIDHSFWFGWNRRAGSALRSRYGLKRERFLPLGVDPTFRSQNLGWLTFPRVCICQFHRGGGNISDVVCFDRMTNFGWAGVGEGAWSALRGRFDLKREIPSFGS